ncbi:MAG: YjbH domain-containing protein, partial [Burkholderiales bacterium]
VGFRDVAGTGLFSGEYVVANKRTGDFDWSLGLGWGYLAGTGRFRNPRSSSFGSSFDTRATALEQGGEFSWISYFRGRASLFGGVQYQTPWDSLILKAEYDGNDYQNEPQLNNQQQDSRFNFGLTYRAAKWADITLAYERGNIFTLGVSLHTQANRLTQPKIADPAPVPVLPVWPARPVDWAATNRELERQTDWQVSRIEQRDNEVHVVVDDAEATYWRSRVDRMAAVLHRDAPAEVEKFTMTFRNRGAEVAEHVVDRQAWVAERTEAVPPSAQRGTIVAQPPDEGGAGTVLNTDTRPALRYSFGLHFIETFGGPDEFLLYQLSAAMRAQYRIRDDTWVQGLLRLNLHNNYDKFRVTGPSNLPRVRTFLREYLTTSDVTLSNLQMTHVGKAGANHYYSVYGGYLEDMFGGVGGEWLYRPFAGRLAFGVDVNAVRQRDFDQHFGFRDYDTLTGHATMYWETGWNDVLVRVHGGRYLAKDTGATLDISRTFKNGIVMGAFATKTNVSAEEFGEGSFDKGVYIRIPFDALLPRSTSLYANVLWRPLTRDGGAMLSRAVQLYGLTRLRSNRALELEAAPLPNEMRTPARQIEESVPQRKPEPTSAAVRASAPAPVAQWEKPGSIQQHRLAEALYNQQFRNVAVTYDGSQRVVIDVSHADMRPISRAVGRVARTALAQAPIEAREIVVTFHDGVTPQARYEFFDLNRLRRYFEGEIPAANLREYVRVEWLNPAARERDPLERLTDLNPETRPQIFAAVVPDTLSVGRVANDVAGAAETATKVDWLRAGAIGAGLVLSSSILDNRAYRYARDHAGSSGLDNLVKVGDALPWIGFAAAGALALDGSDPRRSRTGYAAVEAGVTAAALATGLKYVVGRARPTTGMGRKEFNWLSSDDAYWSFPSGHTAVAWALATPFALEYDMPWLYGLAALTNLARIGSREHWVSDTVASTLIGYGIGRMFWHSAREQAKGDPKVYFDGSSLGLSWGW